MEKFKNAKAVHIWVGFCYFDNILLLSAKTTLAVTTTSYVCIADLNLQRFNMCISLWQVDLQVVITAIPVLKLKKNGRRNWGMKKLGESAKTTLISHFDIMYIWHLHSTSNRECYNKQKFIIVWACGEKFFNVLAYRELLSWILGQLLIHTVHYPSQKWMYILLGHLYFLWHLCLSPRYPSFEREKQGLTQRMKMERTEGIGRSEEDR